MDSTMLVEGLSRSCPIACATLKLLIDSRCTILLMLTQMKWVADCVSASEKILVVSTLGAIWTRYSGFWWGRKYSGIVEAFCIWYDTRNGNKKERGASRTWPIHCHGRPLVGEPTPSCTCVLFSHATKWVTIAHSRTHPHPHSSSTQFSWAKETFADPCWLSLPMCQYAMIAVHSTLTPHCDDRIDNKLRKMYRGNVALVTINSWQSVQQIVEGFRQVVKTTSILYSKTSASMFMKKYEFLVFFLCCTRKRGRGSYTSNGTECNAYN